MTPRGAQQLKDELKRRKEVDRFAIVKAIEEARGHGDLSENGDYSAAKEAQGFIDPRDIAFAAVKQHELEPVSLH